MLRLAGVSCVTMLTAVLFAAPASADTAADLRNCDGGNQPRDERIAACTRLIDAGDRDPAELIWIHDRRGYLYYGAGDYEAAAADFAAEIDLDPTSSDGYYGHGVSLMQLDRTEEAIADFDSAIERDPRYAYSYYRRGVAYRIVGNNELALADFDRAIQLDPNFQLVLLFRGDIYLEEGRLDEARADLTTALEIAPYDARTYADRGDLGEQAGDTAGAIRDYRIAQLLNPNLYAPEDRLPVLAPEQTAPDLGPLTYKPPQEGLRISFIQVVNDVTAVSEEEEFLAELVYWFTGPPEKPRPISRVFMQRDIGATGDNVTPVAAVELFTNNEPTTVHYDHLLLPLEVPEAGTAFTYAGTDAIWQLGPGESTNGTGELLLSCPPEPDPMAAVLGCTAGVANIAVGTIQWDATFVGWEYVLVPVGYRVAARIDYNDTMETQLFGQAVTRTSQTTFWFDPEIHWWIKRERTEGDQIQTVEAVTIETP